MTTMQAGAALLPVEERRTIIREWAEALESGRYQQGRKALHRTTDAGVHVFCASGVLGEVLVGHSLLERDLIGNTIGRYGVETDSVEHWSALTLPRSVLVRLGIQSQLMDWIVAQNDSGWSFTDIARHVREKILPYVS